MIRSTIQGLSFGVVIAVSISGVMSAACVSSGTSPPGGEGGTADAGRDASSPPAVGGAPTSAGGNGETAGHDNGGNGGIAGAGGDISSAQGGAPGGDGSGDAAIGDASNADALEVDSSSHPDIDAPDGNANPDGSIDPAGDAADVQDAGGPAVVEIMDIADVWSRHPAQFSLVTRQDQQFVAYYDANRQMTVAQRTLGGTLADGGVWTSKKLNTYLVQCDSHNYVTMAIDRDGFIHVSGNMHGVPLVYYRSRQALDITSLVAATPMVGSGAQESQVTYPQFLFDANGDLIFAYRDGSSGNGNYIFNKYDSSAKLWSRLSSTVIDGTSSNLSAYPVGPIKGPDDWFHLVWVWRDDANASTNHDLSYAKTQDFVNWKNAAGQSLTLPITYSSTGIIVDGVPAGGGIINNNTKIGFDAERRVILSYHKNDTDGTNLYNARWENGAWAIHKTSAWKYTWAFGGTGTLVFEIVVEPVVLQPNGDLIQEWYHAQYGGWGAFRLNASSLAASAQIAPPLPYPSYLDTPQSTTTGMTVQWAQDSGGSPDPKVVYMLRWETLPSNRDTCPMAYPAPTRLRAYGVLQP